MRSKLKIRIAIAEKDWTEERVEEIIGNLLRFGVMFAAALVLVGGILYLIRYGNTAPQYSGFQGEPSDLRSVTGIVLNALSLRSRGLIQLGLLLLMATPVARVAFLTFAFAHQHDRLYTIMALIVLALLFYSLTAGLG